MKIVNFTQEGSEWLHWRKQGIGATDISVIMGSNPYSTPLQIWEMKCGFRDEPELNHAMAHGKTYEPIAREWMNQQHQLFLKAICVEDAEEPLFRASLDGYDFQTDTLVEIKCPITESVLEKARMQQAIPEYWYDQMQWQIMIAQPKRAIMALWDYRHEQCITIDMFGITNRIKKMREKAKEFWHYVQIGKEPPVSAKDFREVDDVELTTYLLEYQNLAEKRKVADARMKEVKEQIAKFCSDGNISSHGFKVQKIALPPKYDYEKMRLDGIDFEPYKKEPSLTPSYRITCPK